MSRYKSYPSASGLLGISSGFQNQGQSGIPRSRLCRQEVVFAYALDEAARVGNGQAIGVNHEPHAADPCIVAMAERVYHGFAESLRVEIRHVHMYQSAHDFVAGVPWVLNR